MRHTRDAVLFALPLAVLMILPALIAFGIVYLVNGEISPESIFFWIMMVLCIAGTTAGADKMVSLAFDFQFFFTQK